MTNPSYPKGVGDFLDAMERWCQEAEKVEVPLQKHGATD